MTSCGAAVGIDPFPSPLGGTIGYANDVVVWISGPSVEAVKPMIESTASSVVDYMAANCMALNPEKTQSGRGKIPDGHGWLLSSFPVVTIEVHGLKFNRNLKSDPHLNEIILAIASLAGITRHLRGHLPANLVADVVRALLVGKVGYGIGADFFPASTMTIHVQHSHPPYK